jgi:hypothetical protein
MVVMTMTAVDYDDPSEGSNARLIYSIEKNVIEEETGSPIFEIESETGVIKTAVCCLDRERTPDYSIQVVAMDGGGLKGKALNQSFVIKFYHPDLIPHLHYPVSRHLHLVVHVGEHWRTWWVAYLSCIT